jgi:hypothetical protein
MPLLSASLRAGSTPGTAGKAPGVKVFLLLFFQKKRNLLFLKKKKQKDFCSSRSPHRAVVQRGGRVLPPVDVHASVPCPLGW